MSSEVVIFTLTVLSFAKAVARLSLTADPSFLIRPVIASSILCQVTDPVELTLDARPAACAAVTLSSRVKSISQLLVVRF